MAFWDEPIEVGRLWRGPRHCSPVPSFLCTWMGRFAVVLGVCVFVLFVAGMLSFEIAIVVHDPAIGIGCWAIVGAIAGLNALWRRRCRRLPGDPDGTTEGTGIPIPRVSPPLLRVGTAARDIPFERERYG